MQVSGGLFLVHGTEDEGLENGLEKAETWLVGGGYFC